MRFGTVKGISAALIMLGIGLTFGGCSSSSIQSSQGSEKNLITETNFGDFVRIRTKKYDYPPIGGSDIRLRGYIPSRNSVEVNPDEIGFQDKILTLPIYRVQLRMISNRRWALWDSLEYKVEEETKKADLKKEDRSQTCGESTCTYEEVVYAEVPKRHLEKLARRKSVKFRVQSPKVEDVTMLISGKEIGVFLKKAYEVQRRSPDPRGAR